MLHSFNASPPRPSSRLRGFSIIELLVVVGVIAALIAILVPSFWHVHTSAEKAAAAQQLGGLQSALQAYYTDFGAYPPSELLAVGAYGNIPPHRGSVMLAQALMGFLPAAQDGYDPVYATDPPFGFRTRQPVATNGVLMGGKVYGPYASSDHKTYLRKTPGTEEFFVDPWGNEILYFRANPAPVAPAPAFTKIFDANGTNDSFFIWTDCDRTTNDPPFPAPGTLNPTTFPSSAGMAAFFNFIHPSGGGNNGYFNGGSLIGSDSFLLISAGPDGIYFTGDDIVVGKQ